MTGPAAADSRQRAAELLAVDPAASPADVQRAFLRAARRVHPDVLPGASEDERRDAAAAFDRLLHARDLLLSTPPPASTEPGGPQPGPVLHRVPGRGLGGSLVVLALLAFLLVAIVTVQQGFRGGPADPAPVVTSGATTAP